MEKGIEMLRILCTTAVCVSAGCLLAAVVKSDDISARAKKLHFSSIVVDTHDDTTQRFLEGKFDLGRRYKDGSIDIPRMREGGLGAIFFSIWIPSKITGTEAVNRALAQIEAVREQVRTNPKDLALATTASEVRAARKDGKIAAPRNMTDQMMKDLTAKGGIVQINYHVGFLSQEFRNAEKAHPEWEQAIAEEVKKNCGDSEACQLIEGDRVTRQYVAEGKLPRVEWTKIIEHIDHAVKVAGIDHVGLGSDFDGANMPHGMEDASHLPQITDALLKKGYSEDDVKKVLGENTLRVMAEVGQIGRAHV